MSPLLTAAVLVKAARTLPSTSRRDRVTLVARPHGVAHVAVAPLTRTGRHLPRGRRPVCGTVTRRLEVLPRRGGGVDLAGRRTCLRCADVLAHRTAVPALRTAPTSRDEWAAAFGHLSLDNIAAAARAAVTLHEIHQVSHLLEVLHGDARRFGHRSDRDHQVASVRETIRAARVHLEVLANPAAAAAAADHLAERARDARRKRESRAHETAAARARDRQAAGGFLMPWERGYVAPAS